MAKPRSPFNIGRLNTKIEKTSKTMDMLHNDTYFTSNNNINDLNIVANSIESKVQTIIKRNESHYDVSTISQLYSRVRLKEATNDAKFRSNLESIFTNEEMSGNLLSSYLENKWIKDLDNEIDTVLKYCTKLQEALDLMRESVLSSDCTSASFINPVCTSLSESELPVFASRCKTITKMHNFHRKANEWYSKASKYGEAYVYVVPYNKAIATLLSQRRKAMGSTVPISVMNKGQFVNEFTSMNTNIVSEINNSIENSTKKITSMADVFGNYKLEVTLDTSGVLESAFNEHTIAESAVVKCEQSSLCVYEAAVKNDSGYNKKTLDKTIDDDLELPKDFEDDTTRDGLFRVDKREFGQDEIKNRGALIKDLKRENLIPLYIEDLCAGYYYFEFNNVDGDLDSFSSNSVFGSSNCNCDVQKKMRSSMGALTSSATNMMIRRLSADLAQKIDKTFVNSNQDLTKEIYAVLKHNDVFNATTYSAQAVKVSFLPASDVELLIFNWDEDTHRGISDVINSLIPAKLFSALYVNDVIGILGRGQDKRVYYVKQAVETNISQTLLNVINQIKKSNFNIRQIENLNNILNITGKYNDFFIPVGPTGDSPIQFEIMPGQDIQINTDLLNMLEEMAVNATGVPFEMVQARRSLDYSSQYTGSSLKLLRMCYNRQVTMSDFLSRIYSKAYNYQYNDNLDIRVQLPPPLILNLTNTSQIIENATNMVNAVATYEYTDTNDPDVELEKAEFIKLYMRSLLSSYIKEDDIDRFRNTAKLNVEKRKATSNDTGGEEM